MNAHISGRQASLALSSCCTGGEEAEEGEEGNENDGKKETIRACEICERRARNMHMNF